MSKFLEKESLHISKVDSIRSGQVALASSKSESNRALIIQALSSEKILLNNISEARDTQTMLRLLKSNDYELDVMDAGTTMRFLTAYCSLTGRKNRLTGTTRMQERPIHVLVDALRSIGAQIAYSNKEGYPPLETLGFDKQMSASVQMRGDVSSQYISAVAMLGPTLPQGIEICLEGKIGSKPYIDMTLELMRHFGAQVQWTSSHTIKVEPQPYQSTSYQIESDWSGASYWYSWVALCSNKNLQLTLKGLKENSLQGDRQIVEWMEKLGVYSQFNSEGVVLTKSDRVSSISIDFSDSPDLAQTIAATCAGLGVTCTLTGIESLRIKETDRIQALQNELAKVGAKLEEKESGTWKLSPGAPKTEHIRFDSYEDHRMAMALAPLATRLSIEINDPGVVAKSYPSYWDHLQSLNIPIQ